CAGTIAARNDLRARGRWTTCVPHTVSDSGSGHAHTEGSCAFRLVGTHRSFRASGVDPDLSSDKAIITTAWVLPGAATVGRAVPPTARPESAGGSAPRSSRTRRPSADRG